MVYETIGREFEPLQARHLSLNSRLDLRDRERLLGAVCRFATMGKTIDNMSLERHIYSQP